jgi:hypothetical protein
VQAATALEKLDLTARRNLGISNEEPPAQPAKFFNFNLGNIVVRKKSDLPSAQPPVVEVEATQG